MRRLPIALALLLVAPLVCAQVYKWTDAQGTVHYSEAPPPQGTKYSQVTVNGTVDPIAPKEENTQPAQTPENSENPPAPPAADTPENRAALCTTLKANMGTLQGNGPVVMQDNGQQQVLGADQRKQQLATAQSQYQQYCSGSAATPPAQS